jgi:hypothetical protein
MGFRIVTQILQLRNTGDNFLPEYAQISDIFLQNNFQQHLWESSSHCFFIGWTS